MSNSPSNDKKSIADVDWYAIACKIRSQNQQLKEKIAQLEDLIDLQQQQLNLQVIENQDDLNKTQEQETQQLELEARIDRQQEQIEQKNEQIDNLQNNIRYLTQELAKIQGQTARLERECSLLQEDCNEEKNKFKRIEAENKDLRIRLQRQQRYNLQYKTALDKFLDTSTSNNNSNRDTTKGVGITSWSEDKVDDIFDIRQDNLDSNNLDDDSWSDDLDEDPSLTLNNTNQKKDIKLPEHKSKESFGGKDREQSTKNDRGDNKNNGHRRFIKLPSFGLGKKNED